jgi:uncharacterized protein YjbI with pentapeptide repeats
MDRNRAVPADEGAPLPPGDVADQRGAGQDYPSWRRLVPPGRWPLDARPTCASDRCVGVCLPGGDKCWAHADQSQVDAGLERLSEDGRLDAHGVPITKDLLTCLLAAAPRGEEGNPILAYADFGSATFAEAADFGGMTFSGGADFSYAEFNGEAKFSQAVISSASFDGATFQGRANFAYATFHYLAGFRQTRFASWAFFLAAAFKGNAYFDHAVFGHDRADFTEAVFEDAASFQKTAFGIHSRARSDQGEASFNRAVFRGIAQFGSATFELPARFDGVAFGGDADFGGVIFEGSASFDRAVFDQARSLGPLLACSELRLDGMRSTQPVLITASAPYLSCRRGRFLAGAQFRLRGAQVVLDDSDLSCPSILVSIPDEAAEKLTEPERRLSRRWGQLMSGKHQKLPQLLSLQYADVAGLRLSRVDLADCRFYGAHNLDRLRVEADVILPTAPARRVQGRRQVIADERAWRASRSRRWAAPSWPDRAGTVPGVQEPGEIAGLYRALRKGREDSRDEPGAADFYYGKMEMRRCARRNLVSNGTGSHTDAVPRGFAEPGILTAYWLISGYGLRAWRALACLTVLTAGFAVAFHLIGFTTPPHPNSYWTSLLYAFRATLSLTDDDVKLTAWGRFLQALLRLTGPVLLGLALLALRNRVKR